MFEASERFVYHSEDVAQIVDLLNCNNRNIEAVFDILLPEFSQHPSSLLRLICRVNRFLDPGYIWSRMHEPV
jgi:hypothetical protein